MSSYLSCAPHLPRRRNLHYLLRGSLWSLHPDAFSKRARDLSTITNDSIEVIAGLGNSKAKQLHAWDISCLSVINKCNKRFLFCSYISTFTINLIHNYHALRLNYEQCDTRMIHGIRKIAQVSNTMHQRTFHFIASLDW